MPCRAGRGGLACRFDAMDTVEESDGLKDLQAPLKAFKKTKGFFIGIDSDGCAFDAMEIKHKECFVPNFIKHFKLQPIAKMAREAFEFVNLYSRSRGSNRWLAVKEVLDLLRERAEVKARGFVVPAWTGLTRFIESGCTLSNDGLRDFIGKAADPGIVNDLLTMYDWTRAVNDSVADIVKGVPPFPFVRECIAKASAKADLMVVSATPTEALIREWEEHGLAGSMAIIAGQEMGKKEEHLAIAAADKYPSDHILMVGDALGDYRAAKKVKALFYPINPGAEDGSWERLFKEGLDRFFGGTFAGDYEARLLAEFEACLPVTPPWRK